jgi:hypothetical protein
VVVDSPRCRYVVLVWLLLALLQGWPLLRQQAYCGWPIGRLLSVARVKSTA